MIPYIIIAIIALIVFTITFYTPGYLKKAQTVGPIESSGDGAYKIEIQLDSDLDWC